MARRGDGLRVRFARIPGETPATVLREPLYLPAVLGEFAVDESAEHSEYRTVGSGTFSQGTASRRTLSTTARQAGADEGPDLRSIDLEALTLDWDAPWLLERGVSPAHVKRELTRILRSKKPFEVLAMLRLGETRPEEVRMYATLRSVRRVLKHGEADTRYYSLSLREWRRPGVTRRAHSAREGRHRRKLPAKHVLKAGDTLYSLSKYYYGEYRGWRDIAEANGIRGWGAKNPIINHRRFKVGDRVVIRQLARTEPDSLG